MCKNGQFSFMQSNICFTRTSLNNDVVWWFSSLNKKRTCRPLNPCKHNFEHCGLKRTQHISNNSTAVQTLSFSFCFIDWSRLLITYKDGCMCTLIPNVFNLVSLYQEIQKSNKVLSINVKQSWSQICLVLFKPKVKHRNLLNRR